MIRYPETVLKSSVDEELILMDTSGGEYFSLNGTGAAILATLIETDNIAETARLISSIYDVSPEELATDIKALLQQLVEKGLILTDLV